MHYNRADQAALHCKSKERRALILTTGAPLRLLLFFKGGVRLCVLRVQNAFILVDLTLFIGGRRVCIIPSLSIFYAHFREFQLSEPW